METTIVFRVKGLVVKEGCIKENSVQHLDV